MRLRLLILAAGLFCVRLLLGCFIAPRTEENVLLASLFILLLFEAHEATEKALGKSQFPKWNWLIIAVKSAVTLLAMAMFVAGCSFLRLSIRRPVILGPELLLGLLLIGVVILFLWLVLSARPNERAE